MKNYDANSSINVERNLIYHNKPNNESKFLKAKYVII